MLFHRALRGGPVGDTFLEGALVRRRAGAATYTTPTLQSMAFQFREFLYVLRRSPGHPLHPIAVLPWRRDLSTAGELAVYVMQGWWATIDEEEFFALWGRLPFQEEREAMRAARRAPAAWARALADAQIAGRAG
jgi:hypothetical protein